MKKYNILTIDGGGVRGVFAAQILSMLQNELGFLSKVDLFSGTSTGALIALSLAAGFLPEQIVALYQKLAPVLFPHHHEISSSKAKYDSSCFKQLMINQVFPHNPKLSDFPKKVAALAFKLNDHGRWHPHVFHNFVSHLDSAHLIDAALASSAAPLYFPSYEGYVDGGVCATNPSLCALTLALEHVTDLKLADIRLLSFGNGIMPEHIPGNINWGSEQWLSTKKSASLPQFPLFALFTEAGISQVDHCCKVLMKDHYHRVNDHLEKTIALDDIECIPMLLEKAQMFPKKNTSSWDALRMWVEKTLLN
jgi:patatin-like phospholipase/acyl hydrolase